MTIMGYTVDYEDILDDLKRRDHILLPIPLSGKIPDEGTEGFGLLNRVKEEVGNLFGQPGEWGDIKSGEMADGTKVYLIHCYDYEDRGWVVDRRVNCYAKVRDSLSELYEAIESSDEELVRPVRTILLGHGTIGRQDHYDFQWDQDAMTWVLSTTELPVNIYNTNSHLVNDQD